MGNALHIRPADVATASPSGKVLFRGMIWGGRCRVLKMIEIALDRKHARDEHSDA
jgi:hypothetical protein